MTEPKGRGLVVTFCILAIAIITLAIDLSLTRGQNKYLQKNIDRLFSYNFSQLQEELFFKENLVEASAKETAYMCISIFQYTTFSENKSLGEIVVILGGMAEDDSQCARKCISGDKQLIEDMGRLALYPQDIDIAERVLNAIREYG